MRVTFMEKLTRPTVKFYFWKYIKSNDLAFFSLIVFFIGVLSLYSGLYEIIFRNDFMTLANNLRALDFTAENVLLFFKKVPDSFYEALIGGIMTLICFFPVRRALVVAKLMANGTPTEGKIIGVMNRNYSQNNYTPKYLKYEFIDYKGQKFTAESDTIPKQKDNDFKEGDNVRVLFDRNNPNHSMIDVFGWSK